jgi:hypothetical protein
MPVQDQSLVDVAIIGAGPAGLTAAYLLTKKGYSVTVIEKDERYVGGISRTVEVNGYRFDIGGHRFFSKSKEVVDLWNEILPDDFIQRPRMSRIYYEGKFYSYPLRAFEALFNLGIIRSTLCMASYAKAKIFPNKNVRSFQDWTVNQFGHKLFSIFFKTYTEKTLILAMIGYANLFCFCAGLAMAVYSQLHNLVLVAPLIIAAVLVYFHHAMKEEAARLEPEELLKNPWIILCTLVTGGITLWLLPTPQPYAKMLHLLGPISLTE